VKRRVLFVGRSRYRLPLAPSVAHKFDALREEVDVRVLASAAPGSAPGDDTFVLVRPVRPPIVDGLAFWLLLPFRIARQLREFRPDAVVAQTAHDAAAALLARRLARVPARIVAEVHGDWRTSTRLYGSSARRVLSGVADAVAAFALRRADAVRTVSPFTARLVRDLGVEPAADFPAYMDLEPFTRPPEPLPAAPVALFVGVLEAYKNIDGLADAWRLAQTDGELRIVGKGSREDVVRSLMAGSGGGAAAARPRDRAASGGPGGVRWDKELSSEEVARALDESWVLVLPSRSEGMGRVLVEAFCRGRGVIGSRSGSIPNLVADGVSGILVDSNEELARALERVLGDRAFAERLGAGARDAAAPWLQTPEEYARRIAELVA
jgi:glycosyltransferase involved in cell wall biosynthesis